MKSIWYIKTSLEFAFDHQNKNFVFPAKIPSSLEEIYSVVKQDSCGECNPELMILRLNENDFTLMMISLKYLIKVYQFLAAEYTLDDDTYADMVNDSMFAVCFVSSMIEKYGKEPLFQEKIVLPDIPYNMLKNSAELLLKMNE